MWKTILSITLLLLATTTQAQTKTDSATKGTTRMAAGIPAEAACPATLGLLSAYPGVVLGCRCNALEQPGAVWGSNPYTSDSDLCTAAIHAGIITAEGGPVWATISSGQQSFSATTSAGITTRSYGAYGSSISFLNTPLVPETAALPENCPPDMKGRREPLDCQCAPDAMASGAVWGSGIYTNDSNLCAAALHAGMIGNDGGPVTAYPTSHDGAYAGSTRNGVTSLDYGRWENAFIFE